VRVLRTTPDTCGEVEGDPAAGATLKQPNARIFDSTCHCYCFVKVELGAPLSAL
jgi:hypothetical protein